ncbi:MAG: sulfotransferase domain-containing protein [Gammaproteobacteria bacterium]
MLKQVRTSRLEKAAKWLRWKLSGRLRHQLDYARTDTGLKNGLLADVFVVSYPKSGRTWFRFMLGKYIADTCGDLRTPAEYASSIFRDTPGIPRIAFAHDHSSCHQEHRFSAADLPGDKRFYRGSKVVLLVRDPRDVLVSYYMHCTQRDPIFAGTISEFARDEMFGIAKIVRFLNIWAVNQATPRDFLLLRYEEMKENPVAQLLRAVEFMGLPVDAEIAGSAVAFASLGNMKSMERSGELDSGDGRFGVGAAGNEESFKVRQGKVGGFADYLSDEDVAYCDDYIRSNLDPAYGYV